MQVDERLARHFKGLHSDVRIIDSAVVWLRLYVHVLSNALHVSLNDQATNYIAIRMHTTSTWTLWIHRVAEVVRMQMFC